MEGEGRKGLEELVTLVYAFDQGEPWIVRPSEWYQNKSPPAYANAVLQDKALGYLETSGYLPAGAVRMNRIHRLREIVSSLFDYNPQCCDLSFLNDMESQDSVGQMRLHLDAYRGIASCAESIEEITPLLPDSSDVVVAKYLADALYVGLPFYHQPASGLCTLQRVVEDASTFVDDGEYCRRFARACAQHPLVSKESFSLFSEAKPDENGAEVRRIVEESRLQVEQLIEKYRLSAP